LSLFLIIIDRCDCGTDQHGYKYSESFNPGGGAILWLGGTYFYTNRQKAGHDEYSHSEIF
jgi:hypothetical protein